MHAPASARDDHRHVPRWMLVLFFKCISKHSKRIFYISSLNGYLNQRLDQQLAASRLNEVMRLAYREETLHQSEVISPQVWGDTGLESVVTPQSLLDATDDQRLRALASKVVDISPLWARYSRQRDEMVNGIAQMLGSRRTAMMAA